MPAVSVFASQLVVCVCLLFMGGCAVADGDSAPAWIKDVSARLEALPPGHPPRAIYQGTLEGKPVFYVTPTCCDIPSELYDADGKLLCYPSGGFAGGDGRCPAFVVDEKRMRLVWRDKR
ncbi:MAG: DUF6970 domain-containing protein [Ramlibacter sp.]